MQKRESDDIMVRVEIAAPRAVVFEFFNDAARLATWMGQGARMECRPGGAVHIGYPNGDVAEGIVEEASENRIVFSWGYANSANGIAPNSTTVDIELTPTDAGTLVVLRHTGLGTAEQRRQHLTGWRYYMGALAAASSHAALGGLAEPAVDRYLAAWKESDAEKRRTLLESVWRNDGVFKDGMGYAEGLEALDSYIAGAQQFMPGVTLRRNSPVARAHGHVMFGWDMVGPDGQAYGAGWNVGELDINGRFSSIVGFARSAT
jgi:uncharacterized protein YndB with AHSA1/START domain